MTFLNHGSFGGCPAVVLETQAAWRARLEGEPVRFFVEDLFELLDWARRDTAAFLGCDEAGLVFVPNATTGVATAVHNLIASGQARRGDQILITDHEYPACVNNVRHMARAAGLGVVSAILPFPHPTPQSVYDAVMAAVTSRTRVAMFSQITSASAMVMPAHDLAVALESRGVRVVLDGAHAPGHVLADVADLGVSYYAANLHKWVCSPKGSAVLWVHPDQRERCRPLVLSNLAEKPMPGRNHLHTEFDYVGTSDPTAVLCVPAALRSMASIARGVAPRRLPARAFETRHDGVELRHAWSQIRSENRATALAGQRELSRAMGVAPPVPESMTGCIALIGLPEAPQDMRERLDAQPTRYAHALQDLLIDRWGIQVPVIEPPQQGQRTPLRCVRISAQLYNSEAQYRYLARALAQELRVAGCEPKAGPYTAEECKNTP